MVKFLGAYGLAFVLAFAGCNRHEDHGHKHQTGTPRVNSAQDPVCGMDVDPSTAKFKSSDSGKEIAFCSVSCKEKFDKDPKAYAMGYCACRKTMPNCDCGHCNSLAANSKPTTPCPCHDEMEHKHDH